LYVTALGTLKYTAVFVLYFSVFGPEPIYQRVSKGDVTILITTLNLYERKVKQLVDDFPHFAISFLRMQPNICQTKYYPFPHSWSKPQLILKFRNKPEDAVYSILPVELPECQKVLHVHHAVLPIT
jgi:acetyl-CoA synthetase